MDSRVLSLRRKKERPYLKWELSGGADLEQKILDKKECLLHMTRAQLHYKWKFF